MNSPADDLTTEQLAAIGRIGVNASRLEDALEAAVWNVINLSPDAGRVLTKGRPASMHLAWLRGLLRAQRKADKQRIKTVCDDIGEAFEMRNTFMHGVVFEHSVATLDDVEDFDALTSLDDLTTTRIRNRHANDEDSGSPLSEANDVAEALTIAREDLDALFP